MTELTYIRTLLAPLLVPFSITEPENQRTREHPRARRAISKRPSYSNLPKQSPQRNKQNLLPPSYNQPKCLLLHSLLPRPTLSASPPASLLLPRSTLRPSQHPQLSLLSLPLSVPWSTLLRFPPLKRQSTEAAPPLPLAVPRRSDDSSSSGQSTGVVPSERMTTPSKISSQ